MTTQLEFIIRYTQRSPPPFRLAYDLGPTKPPTKLIRFFFFRSAFKRRRFATTYLNLYQCLKLRGDIPALLSNGTPLVSLISYVKMLINT